MEILVVRSSRWRYILLLLVSLGFTAIGVLLLVVDPTTSSRVIASLLILFFGAGAVVLLREVLQSRPRIRIDESGVDDRTLGVGTIPWSEISGATLTAVQGTRFICLDLHNPAAWTAKLSRTKRTMTQANRALGYPEFSLNLGSIDRDPQQVYELVLKLSAAARKPVIGNGGLK